MAYWVDSFARTDWVGPFDTLEEAIEQCVTWQPNSTVRWVDDDPKGST
jgi:hypothetical protein